MRIVSRRAVAPLLLAGLAAALLISLLVWVRSLAGWIALPIVAAFVTAFAIWGSPRERMIVAQLVGVALAVDTWSRKDYLFTATATVDGAVRTSDIATVAGAFGGPCPLWGAFLFLLSLGSLALGIFLAVSGGKIPRRPRKPRKPTALRNPG